MNKIYLLFVILIIGCNSIKVTEKSDAVNINSKLEIESYEDQEKVYFEIKNLNNSSIYYVKRNKLEIDRFTDGKWTALRILPCPCDAPCNEINKEIEIKPNEYITIKWSMFETWCGERVANEFVRETLSEKVGKGKYRLRLAIKFEQQRTEYLKKEFYIN